MDSYINLRENFPDSRRITLSIPQGLADTVNSYLERSSVDFNMFVGVAVDRMCRELDTAIGESGELFYETDE